MDYKWKDHYFTKAKEQGYKSRAAYKLLELDKKFKILKKGRKIVDLGAAPGGWMQVAGKAVGRDGFVWGIDKVEFELPPKKNCEIIVKDIEENLERVELLKMINSKVDAVISDMAPKLSGIKDVDNARTYGLAEIAVDIAEKTLKKGGDILIKLFQTDSLKPFREKLKKRFDSISLYVPKARRRSSSEVYLIGKGFID